MARAADGNAGGKIQEPIAVNVPDFDAATMRHHERVFARIGGRYYFGVASQYCPRFGSRQFRPDGGTAIGILVHAVDLACSTDGRGILLNLRASPAWAISVRLCRSRTTRSASAFGGATTSIVSATASVQPVAARILSTLTFSLRATSVSSCG